MNECNGNGLCLSGRCLCTGNYMGSDCSILPKGLSGQNFDLPKRAWKHFKLPKGTHFETTIKCEHNDIEVYKKIGGIPSHSSYDSYSKGCDFRVISDGYDIPVYISFYNPDDIDAGVNISVTSDRIITMVSFWIFIVLASIAVVFTLVNFIYCLRLKGIVQSIDQTQTEIESHYGDAKNEDSKESLMTK